MGRRERVVLATLGGIGVAAVALDAAADSLAEQIVFHALAAVMAVGLGLTGVSRLPRRQRRAWWPVLAGYSGWVVAGFLRQVELYTLDLDVGLRPSDVLAFGSYVAVAVGLRRVVRLAGRTDGSRELLDAAILVAGTAILVAVFVIAPLATNQSLGLEAKVVSGAYPVADLVLLAILARLWEMDIPRTPLFRLLVASVALTLVGNGGWFFSLLADSQAPHWSVTAWLLSYLAAAAAVWMPVGADHEATRPPLSPRRRIVMLASGLSLPSVALLLDGLLGDKVWWEVLAAGSFVLSSLVLVRMSGLLRTVERQATRLDELARTDALTAAPNRRTWDHELTRICARAAEERTPVTVALLDLDHFKGYNDTYGHQAGDDLLREAVTAWRSLLDDDVFLARYGGEEFTLVLPGRSADEAIAQVERLRLGTPRGQTFSAGVAQWDPATAPETAVAAADGAMYAAKQAGRNRIVLFGGDPSSPRPVPRIVLQPIVALATGALIGVEALSRFDEGPPTEVFTRAHRSGRGNALEADALGAALAHRRTGRLLTVNVSLGALASPEVGAVLPTDLTGVVLEISDTRGASDSSELRQLLTDLRGRGAQLAIDELGVGFANFDRALRLRPEMLKLDVSLIQNLGLSYHRAMITAMVHWADEVGATVCAKGIETDQQLGWLREIGVHAGQGFLLGRPSDPDEPPPPTRLAWIGSTPSYDGPEAG